MRESQKHNGSVGYEREKNGNYDFECKIDKYTYHVCSFFRTDGKLSAIDHMQAILKEQAIRTFVRNSPSQ